MLLLVFRTAYHFVPEVNYTKPGSACLNFYFCFFKCTYVQVRDFFQLLDLTDNKWCYINPLITNLASNCKSKQIALCYKYISVSKLFEFWREKDVAIFAPNLRSSILECVMPGQDDRLVILKLENI